MSRLRIFLAVSVCVLFWGLLGLVFGAFARHPLGGLIWGLLLGGVYAAGCSYAAPKFPGDAWNAKLLENNSAPNLYEMLHALSARTAQELPTLYVSPRPEPNAFASAGRDGETTITVTSGLTRHLEKDEVQAVMALMMARLATGAMPAWTLASTLAGAMIAPGLYWQRRPGLQVLGNAWLAATALPAALLTRLAWDEAVVTASDDHAAHLSEQSGALGRALLKIKAGLTEDGAAAGSPATALLFAVPPLLPQTAESSAWRRGLEAFPFCVPDAAARAASASEIVPSYVAEPAEEFRIF